MSAHPSWDERRTRISEWNGECKRTSIFQMPHNRHNLNTVSLLSSFYEVLYFAESEMLEIIKFIFYPQISEYKNYFF